MYQQQPAQNFRRRVRRGPRTVIRSQQPKVTKGKEIKLMGNIHTEKMAVAYAT